MASNLSFLSSEWLDSARANARNLGLAYKLQDLSAEHWQIVLANVEERMRLHDVEMPDGWREALTRQAGRDDASDD